MYSVTIKEFICIIQKLGSLYNFVDSECHGIDRTLSKLPISSIMPAIGIVPRLGHLTVSFGKFERMFCT